MIVSKEQNENPWHVVSVELLCVGSAAPEHDNRHLQPNFKSNCSVSTWKPPWETQSTELLASGWCFACCAMKMLLALRLLCPSCRRCRAGLASSNVQFWSSNFQCFPSRVIFISPSLSELYFVHCKLEFFNCDRICITQNLSFISLCVCVCGAGN